MPVGDDDLDIARGLDQGGGIERIVAFMQRDVGDRPQAAQAALAIIVAPHLRRMGEQNFHNGRFEEGAMADGSVFIFIFPSIFS